MRFVLKTLKNGAFFSGFEIFVLSLRSKYDFFNQLITNLYKPFMKRTIFTTVLLLLVSLCQAIDKNTVVVTYNGTSASVSVASNISQYVSVTSGTSSHVKITQSDSFSGINATVDNPDGEIIYILSGTSTNGEFYLEGSYKCEVDLNGLTLTNPSGPALNIQNGKRVAISVKKSTTNKLTDGANETYKGCIHVKGHTKLKGKGTLNVIGNSAHAIYSKEYCEIKNLTLKITSAVKDGIHCKEYFLMESGTVSISGVADDGIQCELDGTVSTGTTTDHEEEDSGNFYMLDGTLTISNYGGNAIRTAGTITYSGGTQNFNTADTEINVSDIEAVNSDSSQDASYYNLAGQPVSNSQANGIVIVRNEGKSRVALTR